MVVGKGFSPLMRLAFSLNNRNLLFCHLLNILTIYEEKNRSDDGGNPPGDVREMLKFMAKF
jgi:hypothetical protein